MNFSEFRTGNWNQTIPKPCQKFQDGRECWERNMKNTSDHCVSCLEWRRLADLWRDNCPLIPTEITYSGAEGRNAE